MVSLADVTSGYHLYLRAESDEDMAELGRLLYVATTRAADYLILSASRKSLAATSGPWTELLARRFDPETGEARNGASTLRVRVTATEPAVSATTTKSAHADLGNLVETATQLAAAGRGRIPEGLAPIPPDLSARRQYSFSRLTGALHAPRTRSPANSQDEAIPAALDPLGLGTLVHAVMADALVSQATDVETLVRRHAYRHLAELSGDLAEPIEMIDRMLSSQRWGDIVAAVESHGELEFLLNWPPGGGWSGGPYIQGFIDCLYRDAAGGWHVVDYKTNHVAPDEIASLASRYEMQMLVYALAVERLLGSPPVELVLCFLRPGREHHFAWNDDSRNHIVDLVDSAMRPK